MTPNNLLIVGGVLLAGLLGARLAARTGRIPSITGMIAAGLLLGPSVTGILSEELLGEARVFIDIALGLILFDLGLVLDLRSFWRDRRLWLTAALEALLTFGCIYAALTLLGIAPLHAALAAALGVSSSPAVLLLVVRELDARGPVTDLSLKLVAVNNVTAFLAYSMILPLVHLEQRAGVSMVLQPFGQLLGSTALALVLAWALIRISRWVLSSDSDPFPLVVAFILLALGVAEALTVSPLLTLLAFGLLVRTLDSHEHLAQVQFGRGGDLFFLILFVLAGASLHLDALAAMAGAALAFVGARFAGKWLLLYVMARRTGLNPTQSSALGLTLLPMAGLAIGLAQSTHALYPEFGATLSTIVLAAVAILETIGPIATEYALKRAGEVKKDAAVAH